MHGVSGELFLQQYLCGLNLSHVHYDSAHASEIYLQDWKCTFEGPHVQVSSTLSAMMQAANIEALKDRIFRGCDHIYVPLCVVVVMGTLQVPHLDKGLVWL